jgi:hypothetical protein
VETAKLNPVESMRVLSWKSLVIRDTVLISKIVKVFGQMKLDNAPHERNLLVYAVDQSGVNCLTVGDARNGRNGRTQS